MLKRDLVLTLLLSACVLAVAVWQCGLLEHGWSTPPPVGAGEDWDWQLTQIEVARRALLAGQFPGWNPFTQGGQPLWANPELSPLTVLLAIPLGTVPAMKAMVLLHLAVLCLGWALLARDLRISGVVAQLPALFCLGSAFLAEFLMAAHIMFFAVAWLPLVWLSHRRGKPHFAGLFLALSLYAGGHYIVFYGALLLAAVGLVGVARSWRLRPLAVVLLANGLLFDLSAPWLKWVLAATVGWTLLPPLLCLAEGRRPRVDLRPLLLAAVALSIAALLAAPRWLPLYPLMDSIERLQHGQIGAVADPWTLAGAYEHLVADSRPHHELPNSFYSPIPVLLAAAAVLFVAWKRPRLAVVTLLFWNFGWAGAGPMNLWEPLQALPGFDQLRTPERLALLWTPLLGLCVAALVDATRKVHPLVTLAPSILVGIWLYEALPAAKQTQRMGGQAHPEQRDGPFTQLAECPDSNWAHVLRNEGCLNHGSAIALEPAAGLWEGPGAELVGVGFRVDGPGVLDQNFVPGWPGESPEGLVEVDLPAGSLVQYRPPLLGWSALLFALGALSMVGVARATRRTDPHHRDDPTG